MYEPWNEQSDTIFFRRKYCPLLKLFWDESTILTQTGATEQQRNSHSWNSFHLRRPKTLISPAPVPRDHLRGGSLSKMMPQLWEHAVTDFHQVHQKGQGTLFQKERLVSTASISLWEASQSSRQLQRAALSPDTTTSLREVQLQGNSGSSTGGSWPQWPAEG